ncbi:MAG: glycosyltransferase [Caulobacter sp.]|nr:glycosyltransferase [Caulobacter sp.]
MARYLFTTWEGGGHVQPMMLVARGLQARGHQVLLLSDVCNAPEAALMDLPFRPWRHAPSRPDKTAASDLLRDWEADNPAEGIQRLCQRIIAGPSALYARDVLEALDAAPFDAVVTQELLFGAMMAAETAGVPLALLAANVWPFPTLPGLPPFGAGMAPAAGDQDVMLHQMVAQTTRMLFQTGLPDLNAAREGIGLPPLADLFDQIIAARRILMGTSRSFDFAPEPLAEPFRYVGPYVADPVQGEAWDSPWSPHDARPLVVVTSSSLYEAQEDLLRRTIAALGTLPVRGLVTLGPALDPAAFPAPGNVHVVPSAPHGALFDKAALFVTHGGHGSTLRPLMAGLPLLILPGLRDQRDNAQRVVARGAGLMLERDAAPGRIAEAVSRLLAEASFREAAVTLGQAIAADMAARSAEAELEAML